MGPGRGLPLPAADRLGEASRALKLGSGPRRYARRSSESAAGGPSPPRRARDAAPAAAAGAAAPPAPHAPSSARGSGGRPPRGSRGRPCRRGRRARYGRPRRLGHRNSGTASRPAQGSGAGAEASPSGGERTCASQPRTWAAGHGTTQSSSSLDPPKPALGAAGAATPDLGGVGRRGIEGLYGESVPPLKTGSSSVGPGACPPCLSVSASRFIQPSTTSFTPSTSGSVRTLAPPASTTAS